MRKQMSRIGKGIACFSLSLAMVLGSVPLSVHAITSESLNSEVVDDAGNPIKQVQGSDQTGTFYVKLSNTGDTITAFQLATVAWDETKQEYKDAEWVQPVKDWIKENSAYSAATYQSPTALAAASGTVWEKFYNDLLNTKGTGVDLTSVQVAGEKIVDDATEEIRITSSNYGEYDLTEVQTYTDSETNVEYLKSGEKYTTLDGTEVTDSAVLTRLASVDPVTKYMDSNNRTYAVNDVYAPATHQWKVAGVPFGIYVVRGTSEGDKIKYNPVTVNLTPYQQGPVNSWYIRENITASLKAGAISLDKKINDKERDTVAIGDIVDYSIIFGCPTYADRITLSGTTTNARTYTMTVDDIMSEAFTYVPGSLHVQFKDDLGGEWKEISADTFTTSYKNIDYYAYADASYFNTDSNKSIPKTPVTSSNIAAVSNTRVMNNELKDTAYAIPQKGDVYTAQIASRAESQDPNFPSTADNRGGIGVSVFACATLSHKSDFQLFLFRYTGQENLYYWYYYRDSAYNLLRVDDYKNKKSTTSLSEVDTSVAGGQVSGANVTTTPYTVNLTDSSSYLNDLRVYYQQRTGDKVNHSVKYYKDWSVNVFNVTFNVGAMNMWMNKNNVSQMVQIRILYKAEVNENVKVASELNTNKAILNYEADTLGKNIGSIEDTVFAYTYGLNLVKLDGDTKEPLSGVEFTLYKETDTFILTKETQDTPENTSEGTFKSNIDVARLVKYTEGGTVEETATNKVAALTTDHNTYIAKQLTAYNEEHNLTGEDRKKDTDYKELKTYKQMFPEGAGYYYYTVTAKEDGVTENGDAYVTGDKIIRVFKQYQVDYHGLYTFDGVITSVKSLDGVTLNGLNVGNYILVETQKLPEYNELAEDILFSIRRLDDETAELQANGSLIAFKDGGDQIVESGIYALNVLNYKGLLLPSTGGMGTKLFTLIGILVMGGVMVFMIIRRKRSS